MERQQITLTPVLDARVKKKISKAVSYVQKIEDLAIRMALAGNSNRMKILYLLAKAGELCVCDLAEILAISVPAVSQHLRKLKIYNLIKPRRENQTIFYSLTEQSFNDELRKVFFLEIDNNEGALVKTINTIDFRVGKEYPNAK